MLQAPKETQAQQAHKAPRAKREQPGQQALRGQKAIPALPDKARTLPRRPEATPTHRKISTQTLPLCRGLPLRWRRFKGAIKCAYKQN